MKIITPISLASAGMLILLFGARSDLPIFDVVTSGQAIFVALVCFAGAAGSLVAIVRGAVD